MLRLLLINPHLSIKQIHNIHQLQISYLITQRRIQILKLNLFLVESKLLDEILYLHQISFNTINEI